MKKLVSKSSFLNNKKLDKSDIAVGCIVLMFAGFLVSRLLLSFGMVLFGINALRGVSVSHWRQKKYWVAGIAWVACYALTWFWSSDKATWEVMLQLKLPVLLLPLAFAFLPAFNGRQIRGLTVTLAIMLLIGVGYSLSFLVNNFDYYLKEYNISHIIPTPVYKDYICFSDCLAIFIAWIIYCWPKLLNRAIKWFLGVTIGIMALYIHILASKSGLIAFYIFFFAWSAWSILARRSLASLLVFISIPLTFFFAVQYIPTLRERKDHVLYSLQMYRSGDKSGKLGDLSRLISYDISLKIIQQHPLAGVGTGDMLDEMKKGYESFYPLVTENTNKLIPHNQFLTVALGCGIPAMLVFVFWVFMPLLTVRNNRESFFLFAVWLILLMQLMVEPFLEGQFGVFLYVFFICFFLHNLRTQGSTTEAGPFSK